MIEFYPQVRFLHILLISLSGGLFALRGACSLANMRWPHWSAVRWTAIVIDTVLLTSAAMLYTMLPKALFGNGWLALKIALVVIYIAIGFIAMRRTQRKTKRVLAYVLALAVFAWIIGIARMHSPWGWLWPMMIPA